VVFCFWYDFSLSCCKAVVNSEVSESEIRVRQNWAMAFFTAKGTGISQRVPKDILGAENPFIQEVACGNREI
jgi:hypothetical protein